MYEEEFQMAVVNNHSNLQREVEPMTKLEIVDCIVWVVLLKAGLQKFKEEGENAVCK